MVTSGVRGNDRVRQARNAGRTRRVRRVARSVGPLGSRRVSVLGCELDRVDLDQAVALCDRVIRSRSFAQHMSVNVAKLGAMRADDQLRDSVARSELVAADGQGVV